jgi:phosphoglycerate dehydrogenase-like enzyme
MSEINVLSVKSLEQEHLEKLRRVSPRLSVSQITCNDPKEIANYLHDIDILYTLYAGFPLSAASKLKWIQLSSTGVNQLFGTPIMDSDIIITTTRGIHATPIAEYVFGSLLALGRHLNEMQNDQQSHRWRSLAYWEKRGGLELRGRTMGIVGYGAIGSEIGRLADAFGMKVVTARKAEDRTRPFPGGMLPGTGDLSECIPKLFYEPEKLVEMLPECDVVVLAVPLTSDTIGLIGKREIAAMKPSTYLINVARGQIIDEAALFHALQSGRLAGAVLDTFQEEPLPANSQIWDLPNTIITPHVAPNSSYYNDRASDVFAENLRRYLSGEPMLNIFERTRGY